MQNVCKEKGHEWQIESYAPWGTRYRFCLRKNCEARQYKKPGKDWKDVKK